MPSCAACMKTQSKLNHGGLCKTCYQNQRYVNLNGSTEEDGIIIDHNKVITNLTIGDLIKIITQSIKETVNDDINAIKKELSDIKKLLRGK